MKEETHHLAVRPLRVMHVLLTMEVGGAEKLVYDMIRHSNHGDIEFSACCLEDVGPLGVKLRGQGINVHQRKRKAGVDWSLIGWLRNFLVKNGIDVIHAHQYTPMFYSVMAAAGLGTVKVIYTEHGRLYPERWNWKRYLFNPLLARGVNTIVSIAESTKRSMVRYDNLPEKKIKVIHNGVMFDCRASACDLAGKRRSLGLDEGSRIIGTAARLEEIKNIPMMLRVFRSVLVNKPDTVLLIAGRGSREDELKRLAADMGIAGNVKFLGLRFDMHEIYPLFEVFLLTSFTEGISVTLLEAMVNEVPAVVTNVGGNPEVVVDGETGFLVEPRREGDFAERVLSLIDDSGLARKMGFKAHLRAKQAFSFNNMQDEYLALYFGCAGRTKTNGICC